MHIFPKLINNNNPIRFIKVDLRGNYIKIPICELIGKDEGKTLLITAGFDGDEYAGIEAAFQIINKYRKRNFSGKLVVIPIVNIPGFEAGASLNPQDQKYPKNIYPGKHDGTSSERMVYALEKYVDKCHVWLDLHGGAHNEYLNPYFYLFETSNIKSDIFNEKVKNFLKSPKIIHLGPSFWSKPVKLAEKGINYIITEAGCMGERKKIDINCHLDWITSMMQILGMIGGKPKENKKNIKIFHNIKRFKSKKKGIWYPEIIGGKVRKGQKLGEIRDLMGKTVQNIKSSVKGEYLFGKTSMFCSENEELVQICF
jgi:predicted deacylase